MDQKLLNGQDDSSKVEAPLSSPPQVAESHKPQCAEVCRGCCNWRCGGRFVGAWLFCVLCAIITVLFASGNLICCMASGCRSPVRCIFCVCVRNLWRYQC